MRGNVNVTNITKVQDCVQVRLVIALIGEDKLHEDLIVWKNMREDELIRQKS